MKFMENEKKGRSLVNGIPDIIFYFVLLGIYLGTSVFVIRAVHSTDVFRFMNGAIPIATFSGVLSSLANICIILLVVLFHKPSWPVYQPFNDSRHCPAVQKECDAGGIPESGDGLS
ncbi:MAG: hypothetical protein IJI25_03535 [Eubacterium sp.]|nr:hypothetical protein [Eubacterium sp.]